MEYQNIAYCRFVFIWALLFIFNFIKFSPLLTLIIIFLFESSTKKDYMTDNKKIGLLLSEFLFIIVLVYKSRNLYIFENVCIFLFYLCFLFIIDVSIIKLHTQHLPRDDLIYSQENYKDYFTRVWSIFFN